MAGIARGRRVTSGAERWDAALRRWPRAHLLQSHGWGEVQASAGWRVHRLEVAVGDRVLPVQVLRRGAPLPGLAPRLYVPKGPACAPDDAPAWRAALEALEALAAAEGAAGVTVEPNAWAEEWAAAAPFGPGWQGGAALQPRHTAVVDLRGGLDAALARMRPKGRYNVRYAARHGVAVTEPEAAPGADALARLVAATAERQGVHLPGAAHLGRVLARVPGARVLLASVDGQPVSGMLLAAFAGEAIYLYGGSVPRHRERQPSALLHFEAMRLAAGLGCSRYDLWGIPPTDDPSHPWHGLRQFKLALGGVEMSSAGAFTQVRRPAAWRVASTLEGARRGAGRLRSLRPGREKPVERAVQSGTA